MTETIVAAKKGPYGHYLRKKDDSCVGTTEAVVRFLSGKLPAEVEFSEKEGEGKKMKVKKVKYIRSLDSKKGSNTGNKYEDTRSHVDNVNCLMVAKDLVCEATKQGKDTDFKEMHKMIVESFLEMQKQIDAQ